ncbi:unnamed protein product, partial [Arabidopsis halleri]
LFCPLLSIDKIKQDAHEWFLAQAQIHTVDSSESRCVEPGFQSWEPPPLGWLKCNIGAVWSSKKRLGGSAWVLRNDKGEVLLHSR